MFDALLLTAFAPFTLALAIFFGLLALELILALLGGSLLGGDEIDVDAEVDLDVADVSDFDMDLDSLDLEAEVPEIDMQDAPAASSVGPAAWLGLGRMPLLIWIAALLLGFGLSGIGIQMILRDTLGLTLPAIIPAIPAAMVGLWFARSFGALFARLLPKTETQSLSTRRLGRRRGVVSQGTAERGRPAEVRVVDHYGNTHYIRAEPYRTEDSLPQGSEVLVLRVARDGKFYIVGLDA